METPIVYVICDKNCKFEGMTKEQIYTAILQAVNEGTIGDIDAGFVTTIKTINGLPLKFFVGEQAAYDELTAEDKENLFAIITNDTTKEGIIQAITDLRSELEGLINNLENGSFVVGKANKANKIIIHEINNETDLYNLATEYPNSSFAIYALNDINIDTDTDYFTIPYGSHGYLWTEASGAYYAMFFDNQYINIYTVRRSASGNIERRDWESEWILERFKAPEATENDRLQGSGYYIINYMFNTEINSPVYSTGVFYWNGERELRLPTINQYIADDIPHCPIILKDGRFQLERYNEVGALEFLYPTETYIRKVW